MSTSFRRIGRLNPIEEIQDFPILQLGDDLSPQKLHFTILSGIFDCVEKWELDNFPEKVTLNNFPATPTVPSAELITWLQSEIMVLVTGAESVPNE